MLVAVAVCPHPPLLVPRVAAGAAGELDGLRADCDEAIARLVAAAPDLVVLVGGGSETVEVGLGDSGSLAGLGVDLTVSLGPRARRGVALLPLSLTVGAWLLRRSSWTGDVRGVSIASDSPPVACAETGGRLRVLPGRVGLLVLADGSATRTPKAPGAFHPGAEAFDEALAGALAAPDPAALAGLEEARAAEVGAGGRAALTVLGHAAAEEAWRAELLHHSAPYGVGYLVASWRADR